MKTILLTGASGFIGQHLIKAIESCDFFASCRLVLLTSKPVPGHVNIIHNNFKFDITDFYKYGIERLDFVIHAGAYIPKEKENGNKLELCNANITSLEFLLQNLPSITTSFIFLSTVDVYSSSSNYPLTEDAQLSPISLYGWSKLYCEKMIQAWATGKEFKLQILRLGHIYGPGEGAYKKLIPTTIRKVLNKESPVIFTDGNEVQSYLHVSDCTKAILAACFLKSVSGPINVVSSNRLTVRYIVESIVKYIDPFVPIQYLRNPTSARNLVFDNKKMQTLLTQESIDFHQGILDEIESFRL